MKRDESTIIEVSLVSVLLLLSELEPPLPELVVPSSPLMLSTLSHITVNAAFIKAGE